MTSPRRSLALLLVTPAFALAACGGGGDADKISDLVKEIDKNPSTLCDNATDKLLAQAGGSVDACKTAARGYPDDETVEGDIDVKVDGDTATADFKTNKGKQHATFVKEDGDWKVDTVS